MAAASASSIPGSSFTNDEANFARSFLHGEPAVTRYFICHKALADFMNFSPNVSNLQDHGQTIAIGDSVFYIICKENHVTPEVVQLLQIHRDQFFLVKMVAEARVQTQ